MGPKRMSFDFSRKAILNARPSEIARALRALPKKEMLSRGAFILDMDIISDNRAAQIFGTKELLENTGQIFEYFINPFVIDQEPFFSETSIFTKVAGIIDNMNSGAVSRLIPFSEKSRLTEGIILHGKDLYFLENVEKGKIEDVIDSIPSKLLARSFEDRISYSSLESASAALGRLARVSTQEKVANILSGMNSLRAPAITQHLYPDDLRDEMIRRLLNIENLDTERLRREDVLHDILRVQKEQEDNEGNDIETDLLDVNPKDPLKTKVNWDLMNYANDPTHEHR